MADLMQSLIRIKHVEVGGFHLKVSPEAQSGEFDRFPSSFLFIFLPAQPSCVSPAFLKRPFKALRRDSSREPP